MKSSFTIHDNSEDNGRDLNYMYGADRYKITKRDIAALLEGKILYSDINGEYATIIKLVDDDEEK